MLSIDDRDFTIYKFRRLCEAIATTYPTITMAEYLNNEHPSRFVLMRHDVDRMPGKALETAQIEHELGIKATYYFRSTKSVFKPEIMKQIQNMGHEVGYHYETLSEANGDPEKGIELFQSHLNDFKKIANVRTICMHGSPLSKYDNRDLWDVYDFEDFGILGEAYLSAGEDLNYFTDSGRTWCFGSSMRDYIPGKTEHLSADTTDDLIELIEKNEYNNFYILAHPERWSSTVAGWGLYYSMDILFNLGKKFLMGVSGVNNCKDGLENSSISITVDIEDWYHIPSVCGSDFSVYKDVDEFFERWGKRYDYLSEPTKKILDILDEFNVTATFFVVADVEEHYPGLIESISKRGHEIGCHGAHHSCGINSKTKEPLMTIKEFEAETLEAKKKLEKASGKEVIGYRAPNALVTGEMLDSLEKIGFKYDSSVSVNSLYNKTDSSLKGVSSVPYHPAHGSLEPGGVRSFIEFPWSYYDIGAKIPTSGGPMLRFLGSQIILKGLRQSLNRGHTIFYFHPIDISNEKFPDVGKGRPFYWAVKGGIVEKRIRHVLKNLEHVNKVPLKDMVG
ncbi:polysaccharide deacetylase family protein [Methanococcoides orientis]|uniref:polysaccharide deacetylase family protein n=1 Tax=Methanococcoides orientis TaxID=2822137 RepID=UPI001E48D359|nr:polysaccharide deacetylase family protein [Methanococcoides orientis]UGV40613.1 polysaccharide deacetylase family protein [Methanococcoides orientis]